MGGEAMRGEGETTGCAGFQRKMNNEDSYMKKRSDFKDQIRRPEEVNESKLKFLEGN
jgi:hypothetical protein